MNYEISFSEGVAYYFYHLAQAVTSEVGKNWYAIVNVTASETRYVQFASGYCSCPEPCRCDGFEFEAEVVSNKYADPPLTFDEEAALVDAGWSLDRNYLKVGGPGDEGLRFTCAAVEEGLKILGVVDGDALEIKVETHHWGNCNG